MADLVTLEKVKRYLFGNEPNLDADEILADLITSSSAWVERQIGRTFGTQTVTETRNGDGTNRMLLKQKPVVSVTSVTIDGETIPRRTTVDGSGWVLSDDGIDLVGYLFTGSGLSWPGYSTLSTEPFREGVQNVVFVYTAGEVVPADLEQAVIEHVALRYRDRGRTGLGSRSGDGEAATFSSAGTLAYIEGVLSAYRSLVVA